MEKFHLIRALSLFFWHSISFSNRLIFFRWEKPNQKLSDESLKNERLTLDCFVYNTQHLKSWSISCCENNNQNFNGELLWVRAQQKKKSLACHKKFERDLSCSAVAAAAAAARYLNFVCFPPGRLTCRLINCDKRVVRRLCEQLQQQQQQQISIYFKFLCTHNTHACMTNAIKPANIDFHGIVYSIFLPIK